MRSFLAACLIAAVLPFASHQESKGEQALAFPGWPAEFQEPAWRELPIEAHEERYWGGFEGRIARFSDGQRTALVRWVPQATRRLHSGAECYRASGYTLVALPSELDASGALWSVFAARLGSTHLHVRERIEDQSGASWSDTSSWFWSALLGRSKGPWIATTIAELAQDPGAELRIESALR